MKIRDGRYTYTGKEQIEKAMERKEEQIEELRSRLGTVAYWAEAQRNLHLPYISGTLDTSISPREKKTEHLCNQIARNLWCSECSTTWPCKYIDQLQELRHFVQGHLEESDEDDFKTKIRNMQPKEKRGQLNMHI